MTNPYVPLLIMSAAALVLAFGAQDRGGDQASEG